MRRLTTLLLLNSDERQDLQDHKTAAANMASADLSQILPRVLIVSRRTVRKNKFVDFAGEYHLDLIVGYGAVLVIVPRVTGVYLLLESFEPIHGVLCEGEDIDPSYYEAEISGLSSEELEEICHLHAGDTVIDREKDSIELCLAKLCLEHNIEEFDNDRSSSDDDDILASSWCLNLRFLRKRGEMEPGGPRWSGGSSPCSNGCWCPRCSVRRNSNHRKVAIRTAMPIISWRGEAYGVPPLSREVGWQETPPPSQFPRYAAFFLSPINLFQGKTLASRIVLQIED